MLLRRVIEHVKSQNWTAVAIDFVIVVVGVFIGIQVSNWNDARAEEERRRQIISALVTNISDAIRVQERFIEEIESGLAQWEAANARGDKPPPFVFRIDGSDTAPDTWSTFEQMELTNLFDPVTLFDLTFFYSELEGVGRKYVRYVTFVENEILPGLIGDEDVFYDEQGRLRPVFLANMDRLQEYRAETLRMNLWASCLVYRLEATRGFDETCRRADFRLDGMPADAASDASAP